MCSWLTSSRNLDQPGEIPVKSQAYLRREQSWVQHTLTVDQLLWRHLNSQQPHTDTHRQWKHGSQQSVSFGSRLLPHHPHHLHQQHRVRWVPQPLQPLIMLAWKWQSCFVFVYDLSLCVLAASCCLRYTNRPLPCKRLLGYNIQTINTSCDLSAIMWVKSPLSLYMQHDMMKDDFNLLEQQQGRQFLISCLFSCRRHRCSMNKHC